MKARLAICIGISVASMLISVRTAKQINARCNATDKKIVATYANFFESKTWCDQTKVIDNLVTGAGRFEITDVQFHYSDALSDDPPTVENLISKVQGSFTKTFIAVTHMNENAMAVAYYASIAARNTAISTLVAAGWTQGVEFDGVSGEAPNPAPGIILRGTGISNRIAPWLSSSALVLAIGCSSIGLKSYFGTFSDPGDNSGNTFMGLDNSTSMDAACGIIKDVISRLGCFDFPLHGHEIDDAMSGQYWTTLVTVAGNTKNSLHCLKSCWDWSTTFRFVGVDSITGEAVWGAEHEEATSYYQLRGYAYTNASAEVLDSVPGFGTDGTRYLRVHAVPLPNGYGEYDVVEYDDDRFISISPRFKPLDLIPPEFLSYTPGNEYELDAISLDPVKTTLPVYGGKDMATLQETLESSDPTPITSGQEELTGDAIVFAFHPGAVWRVFQHLEQHYPTSDGSPAEIVWFYTFGVPDPSEITSVVNLVRSNNQAAGGYPANPDLQIVGDGGWATWPDAEDWSIQSSVLRGYGPIYPQGAIGVIPTLDDAEIERYLTAAEEYIGEQYVYDDVVFFVGDALNDTSATWLRDEVQYFAHAFPVETNVSFRYESDFGNDYAGMRAESYAAINAGVRWVFTQGISYNVDKLTGFVHGSAWDPLQLTTRQRNVWVNFSCDAAGTWLGWPHQCKRILFNQLDRAVGVGFFGPLMDGDGILHRRARDIFLAEMAKTTQEGSEATLAQLGHRFQVALATAIPEYNWYADGWTFFGSIAIPYQGGPTSTAVLDEGGRAPDANVLIVRRNPSGSTFPLKARLSEAADVSLDIYDVAGRRVATVVRGYYPSGEHMWDWKPDDRLASGVYFAVLSARQVRQTAKLVLIR